MERIIKRLENQNSRLIRDNQAVRQSNQDLQQKINDFMNGNESPHIRTLMKISDMTNQLNSTDHSFTEVKRDEGVVQTLEHQIMSLNSQLLESQVQKDQLSKIILELQAQVMAKKREVYVCQCEIRQLRRQVQCLQSQKNVNCESLDQMAIRFKESGEEKVKLLLQKQRLKYQNQQLFVEANDKILALIKINQKLLRKDREFASENFTQKVALSEQLKRLIAHNQDLSNSIDEKNQLLRIFLSSYQGESAVDKLNEIHIIKCLKKQVIKKGKVIMEAVATIKELQGQKGEYDKMKKDFRYIRHKIEGILSENKRLKQQNEELTFNAEKAEQKLTQLEENLVSQDERTQELLIENQACHRLLHQIKGSSLYRRDISEKVELLTASCQLRRMEGNKWRDVTELILVNRRLRMFLR